MKFFSLPQILHAKILSRVWFLQFRQPYFLPCVVFVILILFNFPLVICELWKTEALLHRYSVGKLKSIFFYCCRTSESVNSRILSINLHFDVFSLKVLEMLVSLFWNLPVMRFLCVCIWDRDSPLSSDKNLKHEIVCCWLSFGFDKGQFINLILYIPLIFFFL